jgi:hypothetical protein
VSTLGERRNAARKTASHLMRSGLDCGRDLKSPDALDWLADLAHDVDSLDAIEIGASAILESSGHTRSNDQLTLEASRCCCCQPRPSRR